MGAEEFPSVQDRPPLEWWRNFIDTHLQNWDGEEPTIADSLSIGTPVGPSVSWRPINNLDQPVPDMPRSCASLGHDPELFAEHLQVQAALHTDAINDAIREWSRTLLRPKLEGEADFYFLLRLQFVSCILRDLLNGQPLPLHHLRLSRPNLTDQSQSLQWFLIKLWDALGNGFLQMFADHARGRMRFKIAD